MAHDAKRVAVTGAHGKVGRVLVPHLLSLGYEVFSIDQGDPLDPDELMMKADLEDFGQALDALSSAGEDTYEQRGKDAFFITNDETVMRTPTAERTLGFQPKHRWTDRG